jgi:peptidyl-prolyl cis-trans isomerase A (cyclophilin A)
MRRQTHWISKGVIVASLLLTAGGAWAAPQAGSTAAKKPASSVAHPHAAASSVSLLKPATLHLQAPAVYRVKFTTTKGDFVVEVTRAWAPKGADRFYNLAKNHFFDGAAFFRVLPGFVAQFGISPKPDVAAAWVSADITDDPVTQTNARGMLTFATAGPNTRTTQLFINLADNANLDGMGFAAFGKVISGMDVVDKFYSGYGEGAPGGNGPDQGRIQKEGKAYLDKEFPLLDTIKMAVIVPVIPASAPSKPTAAPSKPPVAKN